jgi:hypothetical protein
VHRYTAALINEMGGGVRRGELGIGAESGVESG